MDINEIISPDPDTELFIIANNYCKEGLVVNAIVKQAYISFVYLL